MGNDMRDGLRSAYGELGTAEYREWEAGLQFSMPFGFRQGHAAVQNAELHLSRDRALLKEQERQVLHDLSDMVAEVDRAWKQCQTNLNRYLAAKDAVEALEANRAAGLPVNLEQVLDAQRRLSEGQSQYYLVRSEYAVAIKNVHLEKGSLFEYGNVLLVDNEPQMDHSAEGETSRTMLASSSQPPAEPPSTSSVLVPAPAAASEPAVAGTKVPPPAAAEAPSGKVSLSLIEPESLTVAPLGIAPAAAPPPSAPITPVAKSASQPESPPPAIPSASDLFRGPASDSPVAPAALSRTPAPQPFPAVGQPAPAAKRTTSEVPLPPSSKGIQPVSFDPASTSAPPFPGASE
jgi:hypothetical protein